MMWEGGGATSGGRRKPSCRERENNRRRERRRRAIAAKIYAGLRAQGNYNNLPKHCDNNEILKALCAEAGWIVEPDGTTYRNYNNKECPTEMGGTYSANITPTTSSSTRNPSPPSSSYFASPLIPSHQPTPSSSSCHDYDPANSPPPPHPFAFLLNSIRPNSTLRISNSAPVTPPLSSPTRQPNKQTLINLETISALNIKRPFFAASAPESPICGPRFTPMTIPECDESDTSSTIDSGQWMNFQAYANGVPTSPTFNLVKPPVARVVKDSMMMVTDKGKSLEFDFENDVASIKAWEGERIHEVGMDDLELTLGKNHGNTTTP